MIFRATIKKFSRRVYPWHGYLILNDSFEVQKKLKKLKTRYEHPAGHYEPLRLVS